MPSDADNREYVRLAREGNSEPLVRANMGLVVREARRMRRAHMTLDDLIQEGVIGLLTAVKHYDDRPDVKFASYAIVWIRQALLASLTSDLKHSRNQYRVFFHYRRATASLFAEGNENPSYEQIAEKIGKVNARDVAAAHSTVTTSCCIDPELFEKTYASDDESAEVVLERSSEDALHKRVIHAALRKLPLRDRLIMTRRFFDGWTLQECAEEMGITRERVRQIEAEALKKMRAPVASAMEAA